MTYLLIPLNEADDPIEITIADAEQKRRLEVTLESGGMIEFRGKRYFVDILEDGNNVVVG